MSVKPLAEHDLEFLSLKGGCIGSYESTFVKMPHCWKSHVTAHYYLYYTVRPNKPTHSYTDTQGTLWPWVGNNI